MENPAGIFIEVQTGDGNGTGNNLETDPLEGQ